MPTVNIQKPILARRPIQPTRSESAKQRAPTQSFEALLRQFEQPIRFSAHAQARLDERNIHLGPNEIQRLTGAIDKVEQKGARESLILMDDLAFVVNVRNRNVITALDSVETKERVFTNIDSTIIVE